MPRGLSRWTEVTASEHDHERAALHFIRERFPQREPFRAWSNFTFIADDGTRNEVDLLVVSPTGVYLVEIKSHPGRMDGDAGTWVWTDARGRRRTLDNPVLLAERKAKKLKSLLMRQQPLRGGRTRDPGFFLRSVVYLSDPDLVVGLTDHGRVDVFGPDVASEPVEQRNDLPGLIRLFARVEPHRGRRVDRPLSRAIADAVAAAGIRESTTHRTVGHYELGELLAEGEGWQDFAAAHPTMKHTYRRIRLYLTGRAHSEEERAALERAAKREFSLLQGIDYPEIESPLEILQTPRGPALVFRRIPEASRLDHWLSEHHDELDLFERVELVRKLAEALRHAHRHRLYHRALAPHHITVSGSPRDPELRIRDWQSAARAPSTSMSASTTGTLHVLDRIAEQAHAYLAPETLSVTNPLPGPADIWGLGAVSFLILTGKPPAEDVASLHEQLRGYGSLTLATAMEAPPQELDQIIRDATLIEASERFVSVDEFLGFLDDALDRLRAPEQDDPLEARQGATLGGTWEVVRRIGSGRSSIVFLTRNGEREEVLKIARSEEHAERLQSEFEILNRLRDRSIIEPYGITEIGGRTVLRLEPALTTLADELRTNGPLSLDLLERYGSDLIRMVAYLDEEGVAHRDIKPDNLGIAERGKDRKRHLVLFDFSLSTADVSEVRVGTTGYLEPFLEEREPKRWDQQAERYAVAVTLHEMATGSLPTWGDGSTDPVLTDLPGPSIDEGVLDPSVRQPLGAFFRKGLARDPQDRFDTVAEMQREWEKCFASTAPGSDAAATVPAEDVDLSDATRRTALAELPLSPKVRNALERLGLATVADLAEFPPAELVRLSGIGAATRRQITQLAKRLREQLEVAQSADKASLDRIGDRLVPKPPADEDHRTASRVFLELDDAPQDWWPTIRSTAKASGLSTEVVSGALSSARTRWRKQSEITAIRGDVVDILERRGGVSGADELAQIVLTARGSVASEPLRSRRARAVLRAALEVESTMTAPRFLARRLGGAMLIALDGPTAGVQGTGAWDSDRLFKYAADLASTAGTLASHDPLPAAGQVVRGLREVCLPEGLPPLSDARLVRLASAAHEHVSVSTRLQLYPAGMEAARALQESRSALLDRRGLTVDEVRARVLARFPNAQPVPGRPQLDELLAPLGLNWDDGRYALPSRHKPFSSVRSSTTHATVFATPDERDAAVRELDDRLSRLSERGGFLALTVDRRRYVGSATLLSSHLSATHLDLDRLMIDAMRARAEELGADWRALLDADAQPDSRGWGHLQRLVGMVLPEVQRSLFQQPGTVVLTGLGLLVRYQHDDVLDTLRDALTHAGADQPLRALLLLVPGDDHTARPVVDGVPIPVITANQWAHVPSAWISEHTPKEAA